jgi:hypothetical protein
MGKDFLARRAAERAGIAQIVSIEDVLPAGTALVSPSVGVALKVATKLEVRDVNWMPLIKVGGSLSEDPQP